MPNQAEELIAAQGEDLIAALETVQEIANGTQSYAYQHLVQEDGSVVEVAAVAVPAFQVQDQLPAAIHANGGKICESNEGHFVCVENSLEVKQETGQWGSWVPVNGRVALFYSLLTPANPQATAHPDIASVNF